MRDDYLDVGTYAKPGKLDSEVALDSVIITSELLTRPPRPPDSAAETMAMQRISNTMAIDPYNSFQVCAEAALQLCRADTCGISLRERTESGEDIFRWIALDGTLQHHLHGTTPRYFSPCGVCVDSRAPLLMQRPELFYKYLDVGPPFHDVLLIPLAIPGSQFEATIWIIAHTPTRKFDREDARVMGHIAEYIRMALTWRMSRRK